MENYKVLDPKIGQGSFGKVAKVLHIPSGKEMVWKVTNYGGMNEKEKQQLYNEVKILREIKADYIVRCYDKFVDKENTSIYLVMEFCKGGDLAQLIQKCRQGDGRQYIGEDFIWRIFTQVVLALYECHRRKNKQVILHRDLKPGNIFLDEKMDAKLGDFGFAKALGRAGSGQDYAQTNLGSPYYMSPEQCNGQDYNEKSDIWSLGVVLYELAALNPPFMATNQLSLALKIKEGNYKRVPSRYCEELMRVIRWMLQVEPADRPDVEDLLNLPHVSMRLRDRALKRNLQHTKRKEQEVKRQEEKLKTKRKMIEAKEKELDDRERQVEALEKEVEEIQRELAEKDRQKQNLIRSAVSRTKFVNKSHDAAAKPHSMIIHNRNALVDTEDIIDDEKNSAQNNMEALNNQKNENNLVNNSCVLQAGKQSSGQKNLMLKSAGSAQNMTPRSQGHDFTEIMGYKNIDISRDVDQSYMLKGSNNTNKKTNSSRNASKNEDSSLLKDHSGNVSQRALAHQSYQLGHQVTSPANQPTLSSRRSRENLKPNAAAQSNRQQPGDFTLRRKGSYNQLDSSSTTPVGILNNSSGGALAGYYHSGTTTHRVSSDSMNKDAQGVQTTQDDQQQMIGRSQYPELYRNQNNQQQQALIQTAGLDSNDKTPIVDSSIIKRANSINSSLANLPSQFQLYGSQDNLGEQVSTIQKVNKSRQQLKQANSNSSSQDHYYGMVKKGGTSDPNSTLVSNAVNMSVLSQGGGIAGGQSAILNTSNHGGLPNHIYQSTSVNSSKQDLSLIQQSLAKNFSKHFQNAQNQVNQSLTNNNSIRDPSPVQGQANILTSLQSNQLDHTRNLSSASRGSNRGPLGQSSLVEPSLITPVNQSNITQNLTAIDLLMRQQNKTQEGSGVDETFQSNRMGGPSSLQHASVIKRSFDSVNESYANLNPCLESQSSNQYAMAQHHLNRSPAGQQNNLFMAQQQQNLQMAMASNLYNEGVTQADNRSPQNIATEGASQSSIIQQRRVSQNQQQIQQQQQHFQVTQSQTSIATSAMGLPPRTNQSWQQQQQQKASHHQQVVSQSSNSFLQQTNNEMQQQTAAQQMAADQDHQKHNSLQLHSQRRSSQQFDSQGPQSPSPIIKQKVNSQHQTHHILQPSPTRDMRVMQSQQQPINNQSSGHKSRSINLNTSITQSQYSAASSKNKPVDSSGGLYQPKFTKRSIEKGQVTMSSIQSQSFAAKPMARRMSSHEFNKDGKNSRAESSGQQISQTQQQQQQQYSLTATSTTGGYYMKNATMIQALAQKSSHSTSASAQGGSTSITHQQFIKQNNAPSETNASQSMLSPKENQISGGNSQIANYNNQTTGMDAAEEQKQYQQHQQLQQQQRAQQKNHQHYTGTILTTKAKGNGSNATSAQLKAISKESVEALMRTAAKIQKHHTDHNNQQQSSRQTHNQHYQHQQQQQMFKESGNSLIGSQHTAPINQTMVHQSSSAAQGKQHVSYSSAQGQRQHSTLATTQSAESSHRRMGAMASNTSAAAMASAAARNTNVNSNNAAKDQ